MKTYEITFITKEEPVNGGAVRELIEKDGGKVTEVQVLGQKNFAYKIEKESRGFYTTINFAIEPEKLSAINRDLSLHDEIMRHLLVSTKPVIENIKEKKEAEKETVKIAEPIEVSEPVIEEKVEEPIVTEEVAEEPIKEVKKSVKKAKKEEAEKPVESEVKEEKVEEKPAEETVEKEKKPKKQIKPDVTPMDEEERLKALDKKLDELLKD